jgi:hypothetical protein
VNDPFRPPRDHIDASKVDASESLFLRVLRLIVGPIEIASGSLLIVTGFVESKRLNPGGKALLVAFGAAILVLPGVVLIRRGRGGWWFQLLPLTALVLISIVFLANL